MALDLDVGQQKRLKAACRECIVITACTGLQIATESLLEWDVGEQNRPYSLFEL